MFGGDIEEEMRHGIDDISRRGRLDAGGEDAGGTWRLAGGGGRQGGVGGGADLFSLLFLGLDMLAGLVGMILAALKRA